MSSFNKITIVGYLGRDPELKYTPSGTAVCDFSIATTERKGRGSDAEEITTWFRVSLWGKQAEAASQYLQKGKLIYVEGRLSQRSYTNKAGEQKTSLEVHGTDFQFVGKRGDDEPRAAAAAGGGATSSSDVVDDDIPF